MDPFQAECEDPEAGEEPTHEPFVAILAQAPGATGLLRTLAQGRHRMRRRLNEDLKELMSVPNGSAASDESVLIAYRWPRTQPASDLPKDIVALGKDEYQHGGWEEALEEVPPPRKSNAWLHALRGPPLAVKEERWWHGAPTPEWTARQGAAKPGLCVRILQSPGR